MSKVTKDPSDEMLMKQFINNKNRDIFAQIYSRYFIALSKYIRWLTQDTEQAKDMAQQILVKVYNEPQLYDPSKNFKVWLFTIAKNRWKNEIRNQSIREKHLELVSNSMYSNAEGKEFENIHDPEGLNKIKEKMGHLSDLHKEVIVLKYSNNLTIKEISEIMNCSEGTIKSRLYYALKSLKKLMS